MAPSLSEPFSDSSVLIDFVINQGNGVKGLSEMGLKALPKQYIQPLEERMCMTNVQAQESIPIIDMSNPNDPEVEKSICEAASKWGFFQIVNHDVPVEVLENVKDATYKFFGLAAEVLMKGLNVNEIDETKESLLMGSMRTNLNYYPKCPNPELTVGVGRHSDVSTLTILLQDEIGGLFVRGNDGDNWIHVPPIKGSLVINVGDALQIMSNGKYKSVEHRVVANGSNNRISVPIFVNPRPSDMIGPLPELIENGEKPIYKQVLYSDYVKHFFRKAHDGKKTVAFAEL
ncbi:hypothetical protein Gotur_004769 [Gossypium turneri]